MYRPAATDSTAGTTSYGGGSDSQQMNTAI